MYAKHHEAVREILYINKELHNKYYVMGASIHYTYKLFKYVRFQIWLRISIDDLTLKHLWIKYFLFGESYE